MTTSPRDLALAFLDAFCAGDLDRLHSLFAEDVRVHGPFLAADSRAAYLAALAHDPPGDGVAEVLHASQDGESVALFYRYTTPRSSGLIGQWTQCQDGRITALTFVFDPQNFETTGPV